MRFGRLKTWRKKLGDAGERAAARYLQSIGMSLLLRNCRTEEAELDIVCRDGKTLVFAEVKTRFRRKGDHSELNPGEQLRDDQRLRIQRGAARYLHELGNPHLLFRFDLLEVVMNRFGPETIEHHRGYMDSIRLREKLRGRMRRDAIPERAFHRRKNRNAV